MRNVVTVAMAHKTHARDIGSQKIYVESWLMGFSLIGGMLNSNFVKPIKILPKKGSEVIHDDCKHLQPFVLSQL